MKNILIAIIALSTLNLMGDEKKAKEYILEAEATKIEIDEIIKSTEKLPIITHDLIDVKKLIENIKKREGIDKPWAKRDGALYLAAEELADSLLMDEVEPLRIPEIEAKIDELRAPEETFAYDLIKDLKSRARKFIENTFNTESLEKKASTLCRKSESEKELNSLLSGYNIVDCGGAGDCGYFSLGVQLFPGKIALKTKKSLLFSRYDAMMQGRTDLHNKCASLILSPSRIPLNQEFFVDTHIVENLLKFGHFSRSCSAKDSVNHLESDIESNIRELIKILEIDSNPLTAQNCVMTQYCASFYDILLAAYLYQKPLIIIGTFPDLNKSMLESPNEYYQFWDFSDPENIKCGWDLEGNEHKKLFLETLNKKDCLRMYYTAFHWHAFLPESSPLCSKLECTKPYQRVGLSYCRGTDRDFQKMNYCNIQ